MRLVQLDLGLGERRTLMLRVVGLGGCVLVLVISVATIAVFWSHRFWFAIVLAALAVLVAVVGGIALASQIVSTRRRDSHSRRTD